MHSTGISPKVNGGALWNNVKRDRYKEASVFCGCIMNHMPAPGACCTSLNATRFLFVSYSKRFRHFFSPCPAPPDLEPPTTLS